MPTAHRLAGELVAGVGVAAPRGRPLRGRPAAVGASACWPRSQGGLRQVAEPFLHDVYAATLATVHLAVRDGDEVLYLERMMGRASVPIVSTRRQPAADALHRGRQGAARPRTGGSPASRCLPS